MIIKREVFDLASTILTQLKRGMSDKENHLETNRMPHGTATSNLLMEVPVSS